VFIEFVFVRKQEPQVRTGVHRGDLNCQLLGQPQIVGIEKGDELATRGADTGISGSGGPRVGLIDVSDAGSERGHSGTDAIRRAVVHHDQLIVAVRLVKDRCQRGMDESFGVVYRNDHAHSRTNACRVHDPFRCSRRGARCLAACAAA